MSRTETPSTPQEASVVAKLSTLDRFLAVWILLAMALGLGLGRAVPGLNDALAAVEIGGVSLPIAVGLLIMMYPVLAKVRYDKLDAVTGDRKLMVSSLVINWVLGPAVMFALAWIFLPDLPEYRTGLIIVGLARCIAMVIIWNDLACGDREAAAVLVALNSVFQVLAFGLLGWFYLDLLPGWLGLGDGQHLDISVWKIALNVAHLPRRSPARRLPHPPRRREEAGPHVVRGRRSCPGSALGRCTVCCSRSSSSSPSRARHHLPAAGRARIALPLLAYFALMWFGAFGLGRAIGLTYARTATLAFTAAGNNFELAIAVAIATFGVTSGQALSGVVGPLIEVPVLVALVYVSLAWRRRFGAAA